MYSGVSGIPILGIPDAFSGKTVLFTLVKFSSSWKLSVINNVELTNLLNKLLKDDDIIYFWKHIPKMEMLNLYSVKTLDNPFCDVEVERLMNYFKWLSSDLNKQMGPITKLARLYAMWNYDILVKWF